MSKDEFRFDVAVVNAMSPAERARKLRELQEILKQKRVPLGWQCPVCKRIYGPRATECWVCNRREER